MKKLILLLTALLLISCGAKKSTKLETKTDVKLEASIAEKTNTAVTTNVEIVRDGETETETTTTTYEPIDAGRPMTYTDASGNKTDITNGKKQTTTTKTKSKGSTKTVAQGKAEIVAEKKTDSKAHEKGSTAAAATEREPALNWLNTIGLAIGACVVIWFVCFLWKRNKDENKA